MTVTGTTDLHQAVDDESGHDAADAVRHPHCAALQQRMRAHDDGRHCSCLLSLANSSSCTDSEERHQASLR